MKKRKFKLTDKQRLFIKYYQSTLNAKQAALLAGYSAKTADQIGSELLHKTRVKRVIDREMAEREHRLSLDADEIVAHMKAIATSNAKDFYHANASGVQLKDFSEIPEHKLAAIQAISETINQHGSSVQVRFYPNKKEAGEFLLKYMGKYQERTKVEHSGSLTLEDLILGEDERAEKKKEDK